MTNYADIVMARQLFSAEPKKWREALSYIEGHWKDSMALIIMEVIDLNSGYGRDPSLYKLLKKKTGQKHGSSLNDWLVWWWSEERPPHPFYAEFKNFVYSNVDPRFADYFSSAYTAKIRLDEVRWGGVVQDGIPPLHAPGMINADDARYLRDSNIVFGLKLNGDARAFPKRILAWHEMFTDEVGGVPVTGVFCTLCGTMIAYSSVHKGIHYRLGTSGFLYRSNKLMYDRQTSSLWSTILGEPVIGPLANDDITLERLSVVTTTWGEWRRRHPETRVLSLQTGYRRDYSEGAAYRDYFATDELMFVVPELDRRLKNKDEVLALIFGQHPDLPVAISTKFLSRKPIYHDRVGNLRFVVLTDKSGASRVYRAPDHVFKSWDSARMAVDENDTIWTLHEDRLESADGRKLMRLPAHRAFWFGWYSAHRDTRLVK